METILDERVGENVLRWYGYVRADEAKVVKRVW